MDRATAYQDIDAISQHSGNMDILLDQQDGDFILEELAAGFRILDPFFKESNDLCGKGIVSRGCR